MREVVDASTHLERPAVLMLAPHGNPSRLKDFPLCQVVTFDNHSARWRSVLRPHGLLAGAESPTLSCSHYDPARNMIHLASRNQAALMLRSWRSSFCGLCCLLMSVSSAAYAQQRAAETPPPGNSREELPPPFAGTDDEPQVHMPDDSMPKPIRPGDYDLKRSKAGREETPPLVVDVIIRGTKNEERARSLIKTRKEHDFDSDTVTADARRLITSGRFRNAVPYVKDVEGGKVVIFDLTDKAMVNYVKLIGNRKYSDRSLIKKTGLKVGDPLSQFEVDEGRRRLEEHYHAQGYSKVRVGIEEGDNPNDQGVVYMVDEGNFQRIGAVYIKGNSFVPDGVLRSKISSLPPYLYLGWFRGKFDRTKIDEDVNKLISYYRDFGFFKARVGREIEFDEEGRWATLTFVIDEGPRYKVRDIKIEGAEIFRTGPLVESMKLKSDAHFRRGDQERDTEMLKNAYGAMGHVFADIVPEQRFTDEPGQIDMIYRIKEGEPWRVGEVNVFLAGEFPRTRRNVVLNRLSLRSGDLIDIREIRDSERRLEFSQLFETSQSTPGAEGPKIVVRPPELRDVGIASAPKRSRRRGQSPDDETDYSLPDRDAIFDSARYWNYVATMPVSKPTATPAREEQQEVRPGQFSPASSRTEFRPKS